MIGQKHIQERINSILLNEVPRSLLLIGEKGCGKHLVAEELSKKFNLPLVDISESIKDKEFIDNIYLTSSPMFYLIDCSKLTIKYQNAILKLVEEPLEQSFLILVADSKEIVIPTILNRCIQWTFVPYTHEELQQFTTDETLLKYYTTPGQLLAAKDVDIENMEKLSVKIVQSIKKASIANVLTISNKIAFNADDSGFPHDMFVKVMLGTLAEHAEASLNIKPYQILQEYIHRCSEVRSMDRQRLFENTLLELRSVI